MATATIAGRLVLPDDTNQIAELYFRAKFKIISGSDQLEPGEIIKFQLGPGGSIPAGASLVVGGPYEVWVNMRGAGFPGQKLFLGTANIGSGTNQLSSVLS